MQRKSKVNLICKNVLIILLLVHFSSCTSTRKVNKEREKVHFFETTKIERKAPGDKVYIEFPRTPNERPKSTTKTYTGEEGARTDVDFNEEGTVTAIRTDCPEVDEKEERKLEFERDLRIKQSERETIVDVGNIIIKVALIFSIAYVAKAAILRK